MNTDEPTQPAAQDPALDLGVLRQRVILNLARALDAASLDVLLAQQAAQSQTQQHSDKRGPLIHHVGRGGSLDLLKLLLPTLLPLMQAPPRSSVGHWPIPQIPVCPFCGAGPGAHWPDVCPKNPKPPELRRMTDHPNSKE
jgi:hypothetical protein